MSEQTAESDALTCSCEPQERGGCEARRRGTPELCNAQPADENERIETDVTEWAIRCRTRTGDLHTGRPFTSEREAIASGDRLAAINGAEWWLVTRRRFVTVETCPWREAERTFPPAGSAS